MLGRRRNARRSFECEPVGDADAQRHGNRHADPVADA
jgi:hypothetical protein